MQPENHGGDLERLQQFLERLETELGPQKFQNWFRQKTRVTIVGDSLSFICGSSYLTGWLQKQYGPVIRRLVSDLWGGHLRVTWSHDDQFALVPPTAPESAPRPVSVARTTKDISPPTQCSTTPAAAVRRMRELNSLVEGTSNRLALSGVQQILSGFTHTLFVYGAVGTGKSHLLEATSQQLRRDTPARQILSLSAESFANYYTQSIDSRTIASFRQRFRNIDVLVMDDIDFLEGKKGLQEELLNTLRKLESRGGQLVVAGDRHPNLLTRTSPEIVSRLASGLVCRLESPDLTTRREILKRLRDSFAIEMSDDVIDFVAGRFRDNVRELEGAMNTLHNWVVALGKRMTVTSAREALVQLERDCRRVVRMADIEQAVCQTFGLTVDELRSDKRTRTATQPRMLAMYLSRRLTGSAYSEIGQFFGGRNHSTVVSAERRVGELIHKKSSVRVGGGEWTVAELVDSLERQILVG